MTGSAHPFRSRAIRMQSELISETLAIPPPEKSPQIPARLPSRSVK